MAVSQPNMVRDNEQGASDQQAKGLAGTTDGHSKEPGQWLANKQQEFVEDRTNTL